MALQKLRQQKPIAPVQEPSKKRKKDDEQTAPPAIVPAFSRLKASHSLFEKLVEVLTDKDISPEKWYKGNCANN